MILETRPQWLPAHHSGLHSGRARRLQMRAQVNPCVCANLVRRAALDARSRRPEDIELQLLACGHDHLCLTVLCTVKVVSAERYRLLEKELTQGKPHADLPCGRHCPVHLEGDETAFHSQKLHGFGQLCPPVRGWVPVAERCGVQPAIVSNALRKRAQARHSQPGQKGGTLDPGVKRCAGEACQCTHIKDQERRQFPGLVLLTPARWALADERETMLVCSNACGQARLMHPPGPVHQ